MAASSLRVVSMSRTWGMFSRITGSCDRRGAAMQGRAPFLAPLTLIVPSSGLPPRITNLSIISRCFLGSDRNCCGASAAMPIGPSSPWRLDILMGNWDWHGYSGGHGLWDTERILVSPSADGRVEAVLSQKSPWLFRQSITSGVPRDFLEALR